MGWNALKFKNSCLFLLTCQLSCPWSVRHLFIIFSTCSSITHSCYYTFSLHQCCTLKRAVWSPAFVSDFQIRSAQLPNKDAFYNFLSSRLTAGCQSQAAFLLCSQMISLSWLTSIKCKVCLMTARDSGLAGVIWDSKDWGVLRTRQSCMPVNFFS